MTVDATSVILGKYTTGSHFNDDCQSRKTVSHFDPTYGVLDKQRTEGKAFSYKLDGTKYTSGVYWTKEVDIDGYGTVKESQTVGSSGRAMSATYTKETLQELDKDGNVVFETEIVKGMTVDATSVILGKYTTGSHFNDDGQPRKTVTDGESLNLAGKDTGSYQTVSHFDTTYGVLDKQRTEGKSFSYKLDEI